MDRIAQELRRNLPCNAEFKRPKEAPIFDPTEEEFRDPLAYINKIRPIAEKTGICRIRPPADWQPPFAVDINNFKFHPRVQRLNELEGVTRIKLNFLEQVFSFWESQGTKIKIPLVEGKTLDLYTLHRIVKDEGGWTIVSKEKKWGKVARRMGMFCYRGMSSILKLNYEKILKPFDAFKESLDQKIIKEEIPHKRRKIDCSTDEFYSRESDLNHLRCQHCSIKEETEENFLTCFSCNDSYHKLCLNLCFVQTPNIWKCPKCVAVEVNKKTDAFGFEESKKEYNLVEFGEMADKFKTNYFKKPAHLVPLCVVEKEFWKIVTSIDESITVEYGSDLHSIDKGSGFPTRESVNPDMENPDIMKYVNSPWNLNNFPVLEGSVFSHIPGKISGVKTPWMYVGMCFATFCWHIEDHWSYSINYLHWGEPKTWYGVPGSYAEEFEATMKKVVPELFQKQDDLLHQLTTMFNPGILMTGGVPVFRTDQQAGEFVITFPRAYHSGFNQGYNCAEAVNFAPADWLAMGRECMSHYSSIQRSCVFSHDELICKLAMDAEHIDPRIAAATFYDMQQMVIVEKKLRKDLLNWGIVQAKKEEYELLPDEERQCDFCKTICFMSAITCECSPYKMVCIQHYKSFCECPPAKHVLKYRYTLSEMPIMLQKLKIKAQTFDCSMEAIKRVLVEANENIANSDLNNIKRILNQAAQKMFPSHLIDPILTIVSRIEKQREMTSLPETIEID